MQFFISGVVLVFSLILGFVISESTGCQVNTPVMCHIGQYSLFCGHWVKDCMTGGASKGNSQNFSKLKG